jgi:hypothetical protein
MEPMGRVNACSGIALPFLICAVKSTAGLKTSPAGEALTGWTLSVKLQSFV